MSRLVSALNIFVAALLFGYVIEALTCSKTPKFNCSFFDVMGDGSPLQWFHLPNNCKRSENVASTLKLKAYRIYRKQMTTTVYDW